MLVYGVPLNPWLVIVPFGVGSLAASAVAYRYLESLTDGDPWRWLRR